MTDWETWAGAVLAGIGAPVSAANIETLWAWSNKESGLNVMRWKNPLNTSWYLPGAVAMNWIPIWSYATIQDGIDATVLTLLQPQYYSVIRANLRGSVPRSQWANACADLDVWGTHCNWLQSTFGPVPGNLIGGNMTEAELRTEHDLAQFFVWGIIDTSEQSYKDFIFARQNGMSLASVVAGWKTNPAAATWQTKLAGLGQPAAGSSDHQNILDAIKTDESAEMAVLNILNALTAKLDALKADTAETRDRVVKDLA